MRTKYPQTYEYMLSSIRSFRISDLSDFKTYQRQQILSLFEAEAGPLIVEAMANDFVISQTLIKSAINLSAHTWLEHRNQMIAFYWENVNKELDDIFDEAETAHFVECGGKSDWHGLREADSAQRAADASSVMDARR